MSKTYTISIQRVPSNEELTEALILELMREICLEELHDEAYRMCHLSRCSECDTELNDIIDQYGKIPSEDLTIRFYDDGDYYLVSQTASGGHDCRKMKEATRQAFILLFLKKLWEWDLPFRVEIS